ncbi:MAG: sigma-54-dependent Fis family transcriptional regulator [Desulfocapsa sp.]|nr:sigma-54-dependent Fis family transcriptional regulator [Desulfocapsa sp.]
MKSKILIVDDEILIRESLHADLVHVGYEVGSAGSGEEALLKMEQEDYDLIITDLVMDNMSGIELLSKIKEKGVELPSIIITGFAKLDSAVEALRLGATDYLTKPYNPEELLLRIENCLEKNELKQKIRFYENIIPICCGCSKIRDDEGREPGTGEWLSIEKYFHHKMNLMPSHGLCPSCVGKRIEEIEIWKSEQKL